MLPPGARRILRLRGSSRVEQETDEEIRLHLELRTQALMAEGLSSKEAQREALLRFGSYPGARVDMIAAARQRERVLTMTDHLESLRHDVAYAIRQLRRSPGVAATVAVTFALGIGANATMFGIVDRLLLRAPAHIAAPHELVRVERLFRFQGEDHPSPISYPGYLDVRDNVEGLEQVAMYTFPGAVSLGLGEDARRIQHIQVSGNYFQTLGTRMALGRPLLPEDDVLPTGTNVVVISYGLWRSEFGSRRDIIGAKITLAARPFTVVGVAPRNFVGVSDQPVDAWIPVSAAEGLRFAGENWATSRNTTWLSAVGRVSGRHSIAELTARAIAAVRAGRTVDRGKIDTTTRIGLASILPGEQPRIRAEKRVTILLAGVSVLVLLIACANVANLLLARALRRRREIAVRLALGISRARLVRQLVTESLVLSLMGGIAALAVVQWGSVVVQRTLLSGYAWPDSPLDARVLAFMLLCAIGIGLLAGLIPALQVSAPNLSRTLKEGARGSGVSHSRTRTGLLLAQAALSLVLLVGTGLFVRSLRNVDDVDMGLDLHRLVTGTIDLTSVGTDSVAIEQYFRDVVGLIERVPGVAGATVASAPPFGSWSMSGDLVVSGRDSSPEFATGPYKHAIMPTYFHVTGTRILRGRSFMPGDAQPGAEPVILLNELAASALWPGENAIGKCVHVDGRDTPCRHVIGITSNTHRGSIVEDEAAAQVYLPFGTANVEPRAYVVLVRAAEGFSPEQLVEPVRRTMQSMRANLPYADVRPMLSALENEMRPWRLGATVFGAFGAIALILSALGLYSAVAYSVTQRTHEMGVRVALGAQRRDVARMVLMQGLRVAAAGVTVGAVIALAAGRFLEPLLFQVSTKDPIVFCSAVVLLLGSATLASLLPALRATRTNPLEALRAE